MNYIIKTDIKELPKLTDLQIDDVLKADVVKIAIDYFIKTGKSLSESMTLAEHHVKIVIDDGKEYIPTEINDDVMEKLISNYRDNYCYCAVVDNEYNDNYIFYKFSSDFVELLVKMNNYYSSERVSIEKITIGEAIERLNSSKDKEEKK